LYSTAGRALPSDGAARRGQSWSLAAFSDGCK